MWDPYAELRHTQLPNGLSVYLGTWNRPWVKMKILVHAGAKDDPVGKDGVAHFLEHLLCDNVNSWTRKQMQFRFDTMGGSIDLGGTSYFGTQYGFSAPLAGHNLKFALDRLGNMLVTCDIKRSLERERSAILNEYAEDYAVPLVAEMLAKRRKLFFEGHRLGTYLDALGTRETIAAITLEDIRDFYSRYYTPANMSIVAVGGIRLEELISALQDSPFGTEKPGSRVPLLEPMPDVRSPSEISCDISAADISKETFSQSNISIHAAIPGTTNLKAILRAKDTVATFLDDEIREKRGLTYGCDVDLVAFPEAYEFSISLAFPWENLFEIEDLMDTAIGMALKSSNTIKHYIKRAVGSYKIIDPNAEDVVDYAIEDLAMHGQIHTLAQEKKRAKSVTVEEVQSVLSRLTRDRRFTVTLRP